MDFGPQVNQELPRRHRRSADADDPLFAAGALGTQYRGFAVTNDTVPSQKDGQLMMQALTVRFFFHQLPGTDNHTVLLTLLRMCYHPTSRQSLTALCRVKV